MMGDISYVTDAMQWLFVWMAAGLFTRQWLAAKDQERRAGGRGPR
jgi:hypothetical protein